MGINNFLGMVNLLLAICAIPPSLWVFYGLLKGVHNIPNYLFKQHLILTFVTGAFFATALASALLQAAIFGGLIENGTQFAAFFYTRTFLVNLGVAIGSYGLLAISRYRG